MCFNGVCNEEKMVFPKRRNRNNSNVVGGMYQVFFEISLQSQEFLFLPFQLILSLRHQNKLQFGFSQKLNLWSQINQEFDQCVIPKSIPQINFAFTAVKFSDWLHKDIVAAQHAVHLLIWISGFIAVC